MHFTPFTETPSKLCCNSRHDRFSRSVRLPLVTAPTGLGSLIDALDGLDSVVNKVYLLYVSELVMAARKMVVQLKSQQDFSTGAARMGLVHWINERFEQFRDLLTLHQTEEAKAVRLQFSVADQSFVRVTQIITTASLNELR